MIPSQAHGERIAHDIVVAPNRERTTIDIIAGDHAK